MLKRIARRDEMSAFDRSFAAPVCGVDEVGRGPLAGPVAVAACILPVDCQIIGIDDSKKLTEKRRNEMYEAIRAEALAYRVVFRSPEVIDRMNILEATRDAMEEAVKSLDVIPETVLCDAMELHGIDIPQVSIIRGDQTSLAVAAASILAKVERDRFMEALDTQHPQYGWARNKGYGTAEHMAALERYGLTPFHRRSFCKRFCGEV